MKARYRTLILIALALLLVLPQSGQATAALAQSPARGLSPLPTGAALGSAPRQSPRLGDGDVSAQALTPRAWMPLVQKDPMSCYTGQSYGQMPPAGRDSGSTDNWDKNLDKRGYQLDATGSLAYDFLTGSSDAQAPRFYSLFSPQPGAPFAKIYNVGKAPWDTGYPGWLSDRLLGIAITPGTVIKTPLRPGAGPVASYGGGTYYSMVIYATASQITIVYHSWDKIINGSNMGYGVHIANFCVDPNLLALYNQLNAAGRGYLPGLSSNQPVGIANGTEVDVAIQDSGTFMDPRAYKDWWRP